MTSVLARAFFCMTLCVCALGHAEPAAATPGSGGHLSSFVPLNGMVSRMVHPNGDQRVFVRDDEEPNQFHGEAPWLAEQEGRQTLVMTDPEAGGPQRGYMFLDGFLRKTLAGKKERDIPIPSFGSLGEGVTALWPPEGSRLKSMEAPDVWKDGSRLRLWFDNPNKAGLLFAEVALAALVLLFLRRWWWMCLGGLFSLGAFGCLVATSSRGGFLAFLCGLGFLSLARIKALLNWRRLLAVVAALALAAGWIAWSGQSERLAKNLFQEGQTETSRLLVWREVPRMIVDAPGGWGSGNSARAYIDWYQKKNNCLLKNMISGHLTFLVEAGWPLRLGYVAFWILALVLSLRQSLQGRSPVPGAILTAFAVAACFNPVVHVPELLVLPLVAVVAVVRCEMGPGAGRRLIMPGAVALIGTAVLVAATYVLAAKLGGESVPSIHRSGRAVILNGTSAETWVVDDDFVLHGGYWWMEGQEIRMHFRKNPQAAAVGWVRSVEDLPPSAKRIVLVGTAAGKYLGMTRRPTAEETIFLSPDCTWRAVPEEMAASGRVRFVVGGVAARRSEDYARAPNWVEVVRGAELYIPNWMGRIL